MTPRQLAMKHGCPRYRGGKSCVVHGEGERYTVDGGCVKCRNRPRGNPTERHRKYREAHRQKRRDSFKNWYSRNKTKLVLYQQNRMKTDLNYRIARQLRIRLWDAVTGRRAGSAVRDLGCSLDEFKSHIANQFSVGMSWDNWGKWHLDHKKPLSSFDLSKRSEFLAAVSFANYQPLWARDNLSKGAKIQEYRT